MEGDIFNRLTSQIGVYGAKVPDSRDGHDQKYEISDALKAAFGVFFFQFPSLLQFMRAMQEKQKRNNISSLMKIDRLPSDTRIKTLPDGIDPKYLSPVFNKTLKIADGKGIIDNYRVLGGRVLPALDGVRYHSSEKIHCKHCLHQTKDGITTYYHSAMAGALVKPHCANVLPVMGELLTNEDGTKKQDCGLNAAKRWLEKHGKEYAWLNPILLGDDLYPHEPFCRQIREQGMSFLLTCRSTTHERLAETVKNSFLEEKITAPVVKGRKIENEHNNVLKNRGYNLKHNFGHGKEHASGIFFLLNLPAFRFHTVLEISGENYRKLRQRFSARAVFFETVRVFLYIAYYGSWQDFLAAIDNPPQNNDESG
jgi:hypothetical protein